MTAQKVLEAVADKPHEDLARIQLGITDIMLSKFSPEEIAEIESALKESDAEFERGEGLTIEQARKRLGLT